MIGIKNFSIKKISEEKNIGSFVISPLPQGYGNTLGNILRRVLLTSVPGSSITSVKIDGVQHEYSTLEGLPDDVLTFVLSLKNVVLVCKTHDEVTLELDVKGKKGEVVEVKASDFSKNADVEIVNGDYVLAKLTSEKASLKATVTVQRGNGYVLPQEERRKELGVLPVDANFSPIRLVKYDIVPTRVGEETELDQLNLTVETDGSVTPVEAMHVASDILNQMTSHLLQNAENMLTGNEVTMMVGEKVEEVKEEVEVKAKEPIKVMDFNFSTRLTNALLRGGYDDLRKLEGLTEEEVANIRGMGSKSLVELKDALKSNGINLV